MANTKFKSFADFYPFYLSEHSNRTGRRLHFVGSSLSLLLLATGFVKGAGLWFVAALICGYAFAWIGHFFFEKNRPATFRYPFYSFAGDWRMWWETLTGKRAF
jgi:hypothetical protein